MESFPLLDTLTESDAFENDAKQKVAQPFGGPRGTERLLKVFCVTLKPASLSVNVSKRYLYKERDTSVYF